MSKLDYIKKLYNGKNCYSDHMSEDELQLLHIASHAEGLIKDMLERKKIIFLTGNPGDGKTFVIKAVDSAIRDCAAYVEKDLNNIADYDAVVTNIVECYQQHRPAIIAVNEYPFLQLCRHIKKREPDIYKELLAVKAKLITYDTSLDLTERVAIIDLNERNLLDPSKELLEQLINKFVELLLPEAGQNKALDYNLRAFSIPEIKEQVLSLMRLATVNTKHFAIRDILGAFAYIFTACLMEETENESFYSAIFSGTNQFLQAVQQLDPVYLSSPALDEGLWYGEITEGWQLGVPDKWPCSQEFEENVDEALRCFKEVKRRYYFENVHGHKLRELQPDEIKKCTTIFEGFDAKKRKLKQQLVKAINKLFMPSLDDKRQLHIWTTLRYDISIPAAVAVSSKAIDCNELDIHIPRPADWLSGMEYVPDHIIMTPKGKRDPSLRLDMDFIRALFKIDEGYPVGLLASNYEQAAAKFLQQLDDNRLAEENDDGEIIIASRRKSYKKSVYIQDGQYGFEEN